MPRHAQSHQHRPAQYYVPTQRFFLHLQWQAAAAATIVSGLPEGGNTVVAEEHGVTPLAALDLPEVEKVANMLATAHEAVVGARAPPQIHVRRGRIGLMRLEVNLEQQLENTIM